LLRCRSVRLRPSTSSRSDRRSFRSESGARSIGLAIMGHSALRPRPSACKASRPVSGRGQGRSRRRRWRTAPALRPADHRTTSIRVALFPLGKLPPRKRQCLPRGISAPLCTRLRLDLYLLYCSFARGLSVSGGRQQRKSDRRHDDLHSAPPWKTFASKRRFYFPAGLLQYGPFEFFHCSRGGIRESTSQCSTIFPS
jgi:hypothetical protein